MWQIQLYFAEHLIYGCLVTYIPVRVTVQGELNWNLIYPVS